MKKVKTLFLLVLLSHPAIANDEEIIANLDMLENLEVLESKEFEEFLNEEKRNED